MPHLLRIRPLTDIRILALLILLATTTLGLAATAQDDADLGLRLMRFIDTEGGFTADGSGQTGICGRDFPEALRVNVVDGEGRPAAGVMVHFDLVSPETRALGSIPTDEKGLAVFPMTAGKKAAPYTVVASIVDAEHGHDSIVFQLQVRKKSWVLFLIFGLAGGLGLFLFGMNMMSGAMQRSAGGKMRAILSALTVNRFVGVAVGAFVTMMIQSSSATTVMLVSFVQAQLLSFTQTLGVILGADIGTTITAQLIAFKLTDYALLMIAVGFVLRYTVKRQGIRNGGEVLLGFGILFFGMHVMSQAMYPLRTYQPFLHLLTDLENPFLGILVGTIFTALIQSSSAFTGIVIVLAQQGFLTLNAGIPLILGANVGTCVTAALAAIGASREAQRVALAHTAFKIMGVLLMIWWIPEFAEFVRSISPGDQTHTLDPATLARTIPREIANAHTIFNVGLALVFLPFIGMFARLVLWLLPDKPEPSREWFYQARHLDADMIAAPALALNLAKVEILRLGEKVKQMAVDSIEPFFKRDIELLDHLHEEEQKVDALDEQITAYLLKVGQQGLSEDQTREVYAMLHVTKQFEHIADIIDKQIRVLARKMIEQNAEFSETGAAEVKTYHVKMCKQISRALETFREDSLELAARMDKKQTKYVAMEEDYRQAHFQRIHHAVVESIESSAIHLELMDCFRRISSYSTNVGRALLSKKSLTIESDNLD